MVCLKQLSYRKGIKSSTHPSTNSGVRERIFQRVFPLLNFCEKFYCLADSESQTSSPRCVLTSRTCLMPRSFNSALGLELECDSSCLLSKGPSSEWSGVPGRHLPLMHWSPAEISSFPLSCPWCPALSAFPLTIPTLETQTWLICGTTGETPVAVSSTDPLWPLDCSRQAPLSRGFSRQEHCSGVPFPSLGDLPDPGIGLAFSCLAGRVFTTVPPGKPKTGVTNFEKKDERRDKHV